MAFYFNFVSTDTQLQAMKSIIHVKHMYTIKYKKIECLLSNLQKYCVEVLRSRITGNSILYHKKK